MSEPLTLEDIAALPIGTVVTWSHNGGAYTAERVAADTWRSGPADYDDEAMVDGPPVYLAPPDPADPADSTGARCAVYTVEAGPVDDIDAGPHLSHWMVYAEDDFDVIAVDEAGAIERVELEHGSVTGAVVFRISTDIDGTPDTLPAVDACAS
jgi:hypothetical protein